MAPQCGLAPGFVGIVGAAQIARFDRCRSFRLRVGALPQHPTGPIGYAFNWSPEGVVNEYLNDCEVIEQGVRKMVSAMEWHETLYIDGVALEAFTTSGGLGTMCETYHGRVDNIDYKSIRYPGHMELMNFFFHEFLMRERQEAGDNSDQRQAAGRPTTSSSCTSPRKDGHRGHCSERSSCAAYRPDGYRRRAAHGDRLDHLGLRGGGDRDGARRQASSSRFPQAGGDPPQRLPRNAHWALSRGGETEARLTLREHVLNRACPKRPDPGGTGTMP